MTDKQCRAILLMLDSLRLVVRSLDEYSNLVPNKKVSTLLREQSDRRANEAFASVGSDKGEGE